MSASVQPSSSSRRSFPIKRADAEPLSREDIQYDFLHAMFSDRHAVFTPPTNSTTNSSGIPKKLTFCELYTLTIVTSPRCSKVLKEKMAETPDFAISFAKVSLLTNVGRINTTMAFFPKMKTVLRSYHSIPSLQISDANLQDAPRIKNCLKACLLPQEVDNPPTTLDAIVAKQKGGIVPTTSPVNLIFILAAQSVVVTKNHFDPPHDFLDLFLPVDVSSQSRARAFLWIMFHYLESSDALNPFADEHALLHPQKIPKLINITSDRRALENIDTEKELEYGRRMALYRGRFLQQQIASEEKAKTGSHSNSSVKARSSDIHTEIQKNAKRTRVERSLSPFSHSPSQIVPAAASYQIKLPYEFWKGTSGERTMLQQAWHRIKTSDPLDSDDEPGMRDEHRKLDYQRRLYILNTRVRCKELTPEPDRACPSNRDSYPKRAYRHRRFARQ